VFLYLMEVFVLTEAHWSSALDVMYCRWMAASCSKLCLHLKCRPWRWKQYVIPKHKFRPERYMTSQRREYDNANIYLSEHLKSCIAWGYWVSKGWGRRRLKVEEAGGWRGGVLNDNWKLWWVMYVVHIGWRQEHIFWSQIKKLGYKLLIMMS
jgi:hypothetical protein